jgi:hypothetical protein
MIKSLFVSLAIVVAVTAVPARAQQGYDPGAPCGRDDDGNPLQCTRPDASANLESACMTTGRLENCVPYHRNACEIRGFAAACRLYQMGANCYGGDPNVCNYYVTILRANTACALNGDQTACAYLRQQGF